MLRRQLADRVKKVLFKPRDNAKPVTKSSVHPKSDRSKLSLSRRSEAKPQPPVPIIPSSPQPTSVPIIPSSPQPQPSCSYTVPPPSFLPGKRKAPEPFPPPAKKVALAKPLPSTSLFCPIRIPTLPLNPQRPKAPAQGPPVISQYFTKNYAGPRTEAKPVDALKQAMIDAKIIPSQ